MNALRLLAVPAFVDNYIWLLADRDGNALVVDPGDAAPVRAALRREHLRLHAILLTHHHADHTGGVADLLADGIVPVYAPDDERIAADHRVGDGAVVTLPAPATRFEVLAVPGHTRSHVAYVGEGILFCGDTLFSLGCGRLFEGSAEQMLASLDRLAALPDTTQVCCGHEYTLANGAFARTIEPDNADLARRLEQARHLRDGGLPTLPVDLASEKRCNPFLRVDAPAVASTLGGAGGSRTARFATLRARKDDFRAMAT